MASQRVSRRAGVVPLPGLSCGGVDSSIFARLRSLRMVMRRTRKNVWGGKVERSRLRERVAAGGPAVRSHASVAVCKGWGGAARQGPEDWPRPEYE